MRDAGHAAECGSLRAKDRVRRAGVPAAIPLDPRLGVACRRK